MTNKSFAQVAVEVATRAVAVAGVGQVPVATLVPTHRPDVFVRVQAMTPNRVSHVLRQGIVAIQAYAPTDFAAATVLENLDEVLEDAAIDVGATWSPGGAPTVWPDPGDEHAIRWQMTGTLIQTI